MRRLSILIILVFLTLTVMANPITQRQALEKAKAFAKLHMKIQNGNLNLAYRTHQDTDKGNIYIYNIGVDNGYVVVSGDDRTENILGYVDQGTFEYDKMPENMMVWLKNYEKCLDNLDFQKYQPRLASYHPTTVIEPMITTKWGQRVPYNSRCPKVYGIVTPTGCTATALAQVMRYHAFPTDSCQSIPEYTTSSSKINMPELAPTKFDWENMPDEITSDSPQEYIDAIAELMLYCGQAHNMNYMSSGSGAYSYLIPERLPMYFGYANTMHYVYRKSYTEQEWDSLLIKELVNNRPIIYTAYNNIELGHTFICDGYDGNGMYHINWGWNGVGNGYFRISEAFSTDENLSDHVKNYHLSINQTAILGLKPSGEDEYVAPTELLNAFSRPSLKNGVQYERATQSSDFTDITIKQWFSNTTGLATATYTYGMAICDDNNQVVKVLGSKSAKVDPQNPTKNYYELLNASFGKGMADGHYTIKAVYKRNSKWRVMGGTDNNYIDMVIDGLVMTLTPVPKADFIVKDITKENSFVTILLENPDKDFYGPIYIRRYNASKDKIENVSSDYISFDAMSSEDFDIYVEDKWNLDIYNDIYYLSVDEYDTQYFYSSVSNASIDLDKTFEIVNVGEEPLSVVGDRIMLKLTLENKSIVEYDNYVTTELVEETENGVVETISEVVKLAAGEKKEYMYEIPLSDYEKTYKLRATHRKNLTTWESDSITGLTVHKGAIYWTKDREIKTKLAAANFKVPEEALAINVRGAYTSRVTPNSNPNTIYLCGTKLPNGLSGKNYVNSSNKGSQLQLTDSCDYFIPCEITFSGTVAYTRTIHEDDSLRWDAITLPFSPQNITVDGESIQWYKNEGDEEGSFWLMEFDGIDNDSIVTNYAETFEAYTPYLFATPQSLAGKSLTFEANAITLAPTVEMKVERGDTILYGTNYNVNPSGTYVLSEGVFAYVEEGMDIPAFRAYLSLGTLPENIPDTLGIAPSLVKPVEPIEEPTLLGDVNDDGIININDVMTLVNYIVGETPSQFAKKNADLDGDGQYGVTDVILLVNILTSSSGPTTPSEEDDTPTDDNPTGDDPTDDNPGDDNPTDDNPTDDNPGDDNPTDDNPTDDNPEDDNPTGDDPTDDTPSDDEPLI